MIHTALSPNRSAFETDPAAVYGPNINGTNPLLRWELPREERIQLGIEYLKQVSIEALPEDLKLRPQHEQLSLLSISRAALTVLVRLQREGPAGLKTLDALYIVTALPPRAGRGFEEACDHLRSIRSEESERALLNTVLWPKRAISEADSIIAADALSGTTNPEIVSVLLSDGLHSEDARTMKLACLALSDSTLLDVHLALARFILFHPNGRKHGADLKQAANALSSFTDQGIRQDLFGAYETKPKLRFILNEALKCQTSLPATQIFLRWVAEGIREAGVLLESFDTPEIVPRLILIVTTSPLPEARIAAAVALNERKDPAVHEALLERVLKDSSDGVVEGCARALGTAPDKPNLPIARLVDALCDPSVNPAFAIDDTRAKCILQLLRNVPPQSDDVVKVVERLQAAPESSSGLKQAATVLLENWSYHY